MNKKPILKIKFLDFWATAEYDPNFIWTKILNKYYQLDFNGKPDLVIFGVFGQKHKFMYRNTPRILHRSEYYIDVDSKEYDYCFGYVQNDNFSYYTPGCICIDAFQNLILNQYSDKLLQARNKIKHKFCSFIYTNEARDSHIRIQFTKQLMQYKKVDCPGKSLNNIPSFDGGLNANIMWIENKIYFQSDYKFSIAFENESRKDCFCGRLLDAFCAKSIPIYWGDPDIGSKFNNKAFINCHDYADFDAVIERIIEIDNNDDLYQQYLNASPFLPDQCSPECLNLEKFEAQLLAVVEKLTSKDFISTQRKIDFKAIYMFLLQNFKNILISFMPDKLKKYLKKCLYKDKK